jgi:hypothetical protein
MPSHVPAADNYQGGELAIAAAPSQMGTETVAAAMRILPVPFLKELYPPVKNVPVSRPQNTQSGMGLTGKMYQGSGLVQW